MVKNLAVVRGHSVKPLTLPDKAPLGHLGDTDYQAMQADLSYRFQRPDRVVFQDRLGQPSLLQFMRICLERVAVQTAAHCNHHIQAWVKGIRDVREVRTGSTFEAGFKLPFYGYLSCSRIARSRRDEYISEDGGLNE